MSLAIEAHGLVKTFGETRAVDGIDLAVDTGTVYGVLGPNGAGKTTTIRILTTLLRPDAGRASLLGHDVVREPDEVRRRVSLTGQFAAVDEDLTGFENLVMFGRLLDAGKATATARARELLDEFELTDAGDQRVSRYSGGMRRRLDLAASLVGRPDVIFLDEPTTGLDPGKREDVWRMIRSLAQRGGTVLLTTQYLEEADALADEITVIDHGRVIARGTPPQLKQVVGGQTVVVRPHDTARLSEIASILRVVAGQEPTSPSRDVLTVPVDDDGAFAEIVRRLDESGIGVVELSLRLPSLDDVFFKLTGRHPDADDSEASHEKENAA
jgi:oleandomycin transport system ATP-binding protein